MFQQAFYIAKEYENVFIEPSWLNIYNIKVVLEALGPTRLMFSSDMPANIPVELAKYKTLTDDSEILEQLLSRTAMDVFKLKL
jgi:predicted TIM-barrel fold metal-dependent hydrolase